jgi:hypothetical protein
MAIFTDSELIKGGYSTAKRYEDEWIWIQRGNAGISYGSPKLHLITIDLRAIPSGRDTTTLYLTGEDADECWAKIDSLRNDGAIFIDEEFSEWVYKTYFSSLSTSGILRIVSSIVEEAKKQGRNEMRERLSDLLKKEW